MLGRRKGHEKKKEEEDRRKDEEAKRKKRKTKGYPNMGIKIQKGDKYFGSGGAVGFAAADGGIKKTVYKINGPIQGPRKSFA